MNLLKTIKNPKQALKDYNKKRKEELKALEYDLKVESILLILTKDVTPKQSIELYKDVQDRYENLIESKRDEMAEEVVSMNKFLI